MIETTKNPDKNTQKELNKLKKFFSHDELLSVIISLLGCSDLAYRFILEKAKDFIEIPIEVKYGTIQHASWYRMIGLIVRDEIKNTEIDMSHMPIDETSWTCEEDFEKRFIFVVKNFYEGLKKEGKL